MKKVLSIVMTLAILLGCFGYSAFAKADEQPQTTPAQRRDQILAARQKNWDDEQRKSDYVSQKIEENGGESWHDEERGSYFIRVDTSHDTDYNLTDEQLKSDTETLLDLVLSGDYITNYLMPMNDAPDENTYNDIAKLCNGLRELELREDIGTVLVKRYNDEYSKFLNQKEYSLAFSDLSEIDFMLDQKIYNIWLTPGEQAIVDTVRNSLYTATAFNRK